MIRFVFFVLLFFCIAAAQQPDSTAAAAPTKEQTVKLFLEKIEVEGALEKPQAVFIFPGRSPEIEDFEIKRSFLPELFRPVERRIAVEVAKREPVQTETKPHLER